MKNYLLLCISIILMWSCKTVSQNADQPKFEETHWKLIAMNKKPVSLGENAYIEFKDDKVIGKAACNTLNGEYTKVNSLLSFEKIATTKLYCEGMMDSENQIISNLGKVKHFDIRYGLLYMYGSDDLLLTFKK